LLEKRMKTMTTAPHIRQTPRVVCALFATGFLVLGGASTAACSGSDAGHGTGVTHPPSQHYPSPSVCSASSIAGDQCTQDSDCPTGKACDCANEQVGNAEHTNQCITAECRIDSDCGPGGYCSLSVVPLCGSAGESGFYCHTPLDTCADDTDCSRNGGFGGTCTFTGKAWGCVTAGCAG
jgi:hypothetical protein